MPAYDIIVSVLVSCGMSTFFLFFQIITKYIYELLQNECRLKKVTLPVSIIYFAKGIGFF